MSRRIEQITAARSPRNPARFFPRCIVSKKAGGSCRPGNRLKTTAGRRYYTLTRAGRRQLAEETAHWNRIALAIGRALEA